MNRISQYCVLPIVWILTKLFLDVEFKNKSGLSKAIGQPMVLVANHVTEYDGFLLRLTKEWPSLNVYFMGAKDFNFPHLTILWRIGVLPIIYFLFGVFTIVPGRGLDVNLKYATKKIQEKRQVFIFPEGSINTGDSLTLFKRGAAALSIRTNTPILPISFKYMKEDGKKRKVIITIAEPVSFNVDDDYDTSSLVLQKTIADMLAKSNS